MSDLGPVPSSSHPADRFILIYALAWAGGSIAYTPLLTVLLPARVEALAGPAAGVDWLAQIALAGALTASIGAIVFGWLSDVTRNRRGWVAAGLLLSCALLIATQHARTLPELILAITLWQLALNMMLSPLSAWAGDRVPDSQKGLLGGLMAIAPGLGALSGVLITHPGLATAEERLLLIAMLVAACMAPLLLSARHSPSGPVAPARPSERGDQPLLRMWLARLAVQIAEATLFAYLFFWLRSLDANVSDNQTARLFGLVMLASAPVALAAGRWSDRRGRPIAPLRACAVGAALGLLGMAFSGAIGGALGGAMLAYALFGLSSAVFLSLHSAQTLRLLPRPHRRGRDLGLFNLANTMPSLVMPWLAMALVPLFGFQGLFLLLALLSATAALLLRRVNRR